MASTNLGSADMPTPPEEAAPRPPAAPFRVGWTFALATALLAGLVAWAGGEWIEKANTVRLVTEFQVSGGQQLADRRAAITAKSTLAYGLVGAVLGVALGIAGGRAGGSARGMARGTAAGLVAGMLGGGLAARLVVPIFLRNENTTVADDLILPLMTHGAIWALIGAAGGLALGLGLGRPQRALAVTFGGLLGGLVAAAMYELIGGIVFPLDHTGQPISEGVASRLFAWLMLTACVAVAAVLSSRDTRAAPSS